MPISIKHFWVEWSEWQSPSLSCSPEPRQWEFPGEGEGRSCCLQGESGHMSSWQDWIIRSGPVSVQLPHPSKWDLWDTGGKVPVSPSKLMAVRGITLLAFPLVSSSGRDAHWASNTGDTNVPPVCILQASKSGLMLKGTCWLKKIYSQPKSWELYFICWEFLGLQAPEIAPQVTLRELLQGGWGGARLYRSFATKGR